MICEPRGSVKSRSFLHLPLGHAEVAMQGSRARIMLPRQNGTHLPAAPGVLHHQESVCAHWPIGALDTVRQSLPVLYHRPQTCTDVTAAWAGHLQPGALREVASSIPRVRCLRFLL